MNRDCHYLFLGECFRLIKAIYSTFINILNNLDSDFDGITDHSDDCQKTPKNIKVLSNGCPIDSDFDGIYDYKDLELYHLELSVIEKKPIIEKLNCPSTIKYILPKTVFLFDLGGSGLKLCIYTFKRSYSKMFRLGYWDKESL